MTDQHTIILSGFSIQCTNECKISFCFSLKACAAVMMGHVYPKHKVQQLAKLPKNNIFEHSGRNVGTGWKLFLSEKEIQVAPYWSDLPVRPIFCSTPVEYGSCCSKISQLFSANWTSSGELDWRAPPMRWRLMLAQNPLQRRKRC